MVAHANKTALVTGACGGLGRAIAEKFLQEGANVVVCDVNDTLIEDFKQKVSGAYAECTLVLKVDVTDDAALDDMFSQAEKRFGHLDYVVNNCGIMDKFDPVGDMERGLWDRVIAVNLTAPAMVTKRAVNMMLKHSIKGSIVNIASIAGVRGFCSGAAYTASKHGVIGLTKNTAAYYADKGIRCNALMAGGMKTNIASALANGINVEGIQVMRRTFPDEHSVYVPVEKVAAIVSFVCSDDGDIINGASWTVDGGWTAN
ncbi:hypothetical protein M433DRAFT_70088 [Acidomyces richmondensis BFW]|nr:MAG: hypothetical protein FE78DRAFT_41617 [Acidomyces sp. 'richmondensis']KYG44149.1 hypothetical protein M433DRAFT_70088 [Acidomyces richmondensis BFW]